MSGPGPFLIDNLSVLAENIVGAGPGITVGAAEQTHSVAAWQASIDAAQASGRPIELSGTTYHITQANAEDVILIDPTLPLTLRGVRGRTIIKANYPPFRIRQEDADAVAATTVTADIAFRAATLSVADETGFAVGQLLYVESTQNMEETAVVSVKRFVTYVIGTATNAVQISPIAPQRFTASGNTITLRAFNHAPIQISDLTLSVKKTMGPIYGAISMQYAARVRLERIRVEEQDGSDLRNPAFDGSVPLLLGAEIKRCAEIDVLDSHFDHLVYCVLAQQGTYACRIFRSTAFWSRHINNFASGSHDCEVIDGRANACYAGFDSHQTAVTSRFVRCTDHNSVIASKFRGRSDELIDCKLLGSLDVTVDPPVMTALGANTPEGSQLRKVLRNCKARDPDNRRARVSAHHLIIDGGVFDNMHLEKLTGGSVSYLTLGGGLIVNNQGIVGHDGAAFIENATVRTLISGVQVYGPGVGIAALDAQATYKIFVYITTSGTEIIARDFNVDGCRSAFYFNVSGTQDGVRISDGRIANCGEGIRVIGGVDTTVGRIDDLVLAGNNVNVANPTRLILGTSNYSLT